MSEDLFEDGGIAATLGGAIGGVVENVAQAVMPQNSGSSNTLWYVLGFILLAAIIYIAMMPAPVPPMIENPDLSVVDTQQQTVVVPARVPKASVRVAGFTGGGNGTYNTVTFTAPINKDLRPPTGTPVYVDLDAQGVYDERDPTLGNVVTLANSTALNSDGMLVKLRISGSSTAHRNIGLQEGSVIYWL